MGCEKTKQQQQKTITKNEVCNETKVPDMEILKN